MHFSKKDVFGDMNIGLYAFATEKHCIAGNVGKLAKDCKKFMETSIIRTRLMHTDFAGIYCKGNSSGIVLPKIAKEFGHELESKIEILYLDTRFCAAGNLILMNDNGIILSELLEKEKHKIERFFGLKCTITKIADTIIVGKAGVATNKGCLLHRDATQHQIKLIENVLGVSADIGTVNFGSPYVGAGLIANSKGFIAGSHTSGPELGRIEEALGFLEK
jgi:translation initiation factor 6